jgi:enolase-phosphatase E1
VTISLSSLQTRALVLDIEGTTTPIEFVHQRLFPYARSHAAEYLRREWDSPSAGAAIARLRAEHAEEAPEEPAGKGLGEDFDAARALGYVNRLMDEDRKSPGLKALQGLIFQEGFESGELRGYVYPDVPPALRRWQARGLDTYIYSSGSALAQRLLFGSTDAGDLTGYLKGYFDTGIGPKASPGSYAVLAVRVGVPPPQVLFVSDAVAELDAALAAGMRVALCTRGDGDGPNDAASPYPIVRTFDDIGD